jgi:hypothetical protein
VGKERHSHRFTQAQKDAILKAVLIDQMTPAQAWRAAKAGTLGMPAFDTGQRHVYTIVRRGREAFESENSTALANTTHDALIRLHRLALNHALALNDTSDLAEIAKAAKTLAETEKALRAKPTRGHVDSADDSSSADDHKATSVVTSLLDAASSRRTSPLSKGA